VQSVVERPVFDDQPAVCGASDPLDHREAVQLAGRADRLQ
jgi:hypothetical protein